MCHPGAVSLSRCCQAVICAAHNTLEQGCNKACLFCADGAASRGASYSGSVRGFLVWVLFGHLIAEPSSQGREETGFCKARFTAEYFTDRP